MKKNILFLFVVAHLSCIAMDADQTEYQQGQPTEEQNQIDEMLNDLTVFADQAVASGRELLSRLRVPSFSAFTFSRLNCNYPGQQIDTAIQEDNDEQDAILETDRLVQTQQDAQSQDLFVDLRGYTPQEISQIWAFMDHIEKSKTKKE